MGAEPAAAGPRPAYIFLKPPDFQNPSFVCSLVLRVSNGNKEVSTATPATPPDISDDRRRDVSDENIELQIYWCTIRYP